MLKCNALGCTTNENTQINGKRLKLFSFPFDDDSLFEEWEKNSKLSIAPDQNLAELKLCEIHFKSDSFTSEEKNALTAGAVPEIFDFSYKRKIEEEAEPKETEEPIAKQEKLEEEEEEEENQTTTASPLRNPTIELKSEELFNDEKNITNRVESSLNKTNGEKSSTFMKQIDMGKKVYRLIIRIDKVIDEKKTINGPKIIVQKPEVTEQTPAAEENLDDKSQIVINPCAETGCTVIKTTMNSQSVLKCQNCKKCYIVKEKKKIDKNNRFPCYICKEVFSNSEMLTIHLRIHFTCDMCQAQCSTQISYDKHLRLHVSTDRLLPYKCHKCTEIFEVKADVRDHYVEKHFQTRRQDSTITKQLSGKMLFRCEYCCAIFKKKNSYESHINSHMCNSEFDCAICNKRFKTAEHLATHQTNHAGMVRYACRICKEIFSNLEAVQSHMKTHMEEKKGEHEFSNSEAVKSHVKTPPEVKREEHKCNVCKKVFKSETVLNSHMRGHLSRAHRCPKCRKAFINKATLSIHMKTHINAALNPLNPVSGDSVSSKRQACTMCPSTFESRSELYNHIMTHLEQMHGSGEAKDIVFQGIEELFESDEDGNL